MDQLHRFGNRIQEFLSGFSHKTGVLLAALPFLLPLSSPNTARAMSQRTGDFELEMDAPWRMEPRATNNPYGAIPIQVSIHDADQPKTADDGRLQQIISIMQGYPVIQVVFEFLEGPIDALLGPVDEILEFFGIDVVNHGALPPIVVLSSFESLGVDEMMNGQFVRQRTFTLADIHEVERTVGLWKHDALQWGPEAGGTPPVRPTHALCRRWQGQDCSAFAPLRSTSEWHLTAMYTPSIRIPGMNVRLRTVLRVRTVENGVAAVRNYQRFLTVHLAHEPLPKFDSGWAYGDLHYHSQGTDNDGESGYSYRGTVQAMAAMGLDFAFATDHASNSPQIRSASPKFARDLVDPLMSGLRDLSPDRFAFGIDLLNGPIGANRQVTSYPRSTRDGSELVAPQLFLGSEVDVAPETLTSENTATPFCLNVPKVLKALDQIDIFPEDFWCDAYLNPQGDGRSLFFDVQGPDGGRLLSNHFYARQHLLHLPTDGQRKSAFIASNTSKYGGGTRRLGEILDLELGQRQKGYSFLAHPFAHGSGEGVGGLGPDLVSYTRIQLEDALDSPYVLGLQIWNENPTYTAKANDAVPFPSPYWEDQHQPFHFRDFQAWDELQLLGLDKTRTASIPWLAPGQPRRVFAAGGSDAHGDFNYRREGYFFGTEAVNSTALGNPRNLVYVGEAAGSAISTASGTGRPVSQTQVLDGLRSGNFAITDGPAVRVLVDVNKNGLIDSSDVPMGGVHKQTEGGAFQVIVEWKSSAEFAPVEEIDLLVGVWAEGLINGMVYTRDYEFPPATNANSSYVQPGTEKVFVETPNAPYWYDPNPENALFVRPTGAEANHGQRVFIIDPAKYPVGTRACITASAPMSATAPTSGTSPPAGTTASFSTSTSTLTSAGTSTATLGTVTTAVSTTGGSGTTTPSGDTVVYLDTSLQVKLDNLINGVLENPPPPCIRREFQGAKTPSRMFVRAEVRTQPAPDSSALCSDANIGTLPGCITRRAYTNPVWVQPCPFKFGCVVSDAALDPIDALRADGSGGGLTQPTTDLLSSVSGTLSTTLQLSPTTTVTTAPTTSPTRTLSTTPTTTRTTRTTTTLTTSPTLMTIAR